KFFGDDLALLAAKGREIETVLRSIDGAADVAVDQVAGQPGLRIQILQDQGARHGIPARAGPDNVGAGGIRPRGGVYRGQPRFPLTVRLPAKLRATPETVGTLSVLTPSGERIPLSRLTKIEIIEGPSTIQREWGQRRITVQANVRGRDLGSFVNEAQAKVAR